MSKRLDKLNENYVSKCELYEILTNEALTYFLNNKSLGILIINIHSKLVKAFCLSSLNIPLPFKTTFIVKISYESNDKFIVTQKFFKANPFHQGDNANKKNVKLVKGQSTDLKIFFFSLVKNI